MKFLCDAMLAHLGRKLRAAGYDTLIDTGKLTDYELVLLAKGEGRILLTRDHAMEQIKAGAGTVEYLRSDSADHWAAHLKKLGVDWLRAPFTRCLDCNARLEPLAEEDKRTVPENVRHMRLRTCPCCRKIFWEGSHVEKMKIKLARWAAA